MRAALALLLSALLLASCGGDDKTDQFKKDFQGVNDDLIALGGSVGQALQTAPQTNDARLAGEFQGFADQLETIKSKVDDLKPPDDLKSKTAALSSGITRLLTDLKALTASAKTHNADAARNATVALLRDSKAAGDARRALAKETGAKVEP